MQLPQQGQEDQPADWTPRSYSTAGGMHDYARVRAADAARTLLLALDWPRGAVTQDDNDAVPAIMGLLSGDALSRVDGAPWRTWRECSTGPQPRQSGAA